MAFSKAVLEAPAKTIRKQLCEIQLTFGACVCVCLCVSVGLCVQWRFTNVVYMTTGKAMLLYPSKTNMHVEHTLPHIDSGYVLVYNMI